MKISQIIKAAAKAKTVKETKRLWEKSIQADPSSTRIPGTIGYTPTEDGIKPVFANQNGPISKTEYRNALKYARAVRASEERNAAIRRGETPDPNKKFISVLSLIG